jgi:dihydrofolate synthase/folylpolyglutamate synthase
MSPGMSYREALRYIYSLTDYEKRGAAAYAPELYSLDRVRYLLSFLGSPQKAFRSVHIAGTKGKGSTAAMIESILRAAGYRTGLYTSPHLHSFRERIQAGGVLIPEADVVRLASELRSLASRVPELTTFELMTALAFAWFVEQGVAWLVAEVGLGGRVDATNVLQPKVTVITSISYDHIAILGETLAEIAAEKAGIIKPGVPVVCAPQRDEAWTVIESVAGGKGAPLTLVGRDWTWARQPGVGDVAGQSFTVHRGAEVWPELWIPLLGEYQVVNATTAVATVSVLQEAGWDVPDAAIRAGLRAVQWPGRLEILSREPYVVADSAHNGDSAQKLMAALRAYLSFERLIVIWGASADHVTPKLMAALLSEASRAIATRTRHPRAAEPAWLQSRAAELGFPVEVTDSVPEALELALAWAGPGDLICCAGSVFVAAEARLACLARQGLPLPPSDPF